MPPRPVAAIAGFVLFAAAAGFAPGAGAQSVTVTEETTTSVHSSEDGAVIVVDEDGAIRTTGNGFANSGIYATGGNQRIRVDGTVRTEGNDAYGIYSAPPFANVLDTPDEDLPADVQIHVGRSGRIETTASSSPAILSRGLRTDITVDGTIRVEGTGGFISSMLIYGPQARIRLGRSGRLEMMNGFGINIDAFAVTPAADAEVTIDGTIDIAGTGDGIRIAAPRARVRVGRSGRIESSGVAASGILGTSSINVINPVITMDGTIRTEGDTAHAIWVQSLDAHVTVGGTIETNGDGASGIRSNNQDSARMDDPDVRIRVARSGRIRTTGDSLDDGRTTFFSHGIHALVADTDITMDGMIETEGTDAHGISATAANAEIRVGRSGMIRTAGMNAYGIHATGAGTDITMDGTIRTTGDGASGIRSTVADADITMGGTIRTSGTDAHGIHATGGGETITVSGGIHVTGEGASAIRGTGGGQTLRLRRGWLITGSIDLDSDPAMPNRLELETGGAGISRTVRIPNLDEVEIADDGLLLRPDDDTFTVLDPSAPAMQRDALVHVARAVHGAIRDRAAAARPVSGDADGLGDRRIWATAVGSDFERGADGAALGWDGNLYGAVAGAEGTLGGGFRIGVMGGYARSRTDTDIASISADAGTGVLGVYGELGGEFETGGKWTLAGALVGGYSSRDTDRLVHDNLAGLQTASGSPDGMFTSPSLGLALSHPVGDRFELRPSVRADGLFARHASYTESGAGISDLAYGSWTSVSAEGRAQLGLAAMLGPSAEFEARAGAISRRHANEAVTARLAGGGESVTYDVSGDRRVYGGFVGGRLSWALGERFALAADAEYGRAGGGERTLAGRLKLSASF